MTKYNKLYNLLKCNIDIPINDIDAWNKYPNYRFLYNKIFICEYQNIDYAPMPILPKLYPVILKPVINLYGMGLNIIKVNNETEFYNNWFSNNFWMEFLTGHHHSWDIIILKGQISFHTCFLGHQDNENTGQFHYWESVELELPNIIKNLIKDKLTDYTGTLNVETINYKIIECHLRLGDIDLFPTLDILKGVIKTYNHEDYDWNIIKLDKIYFFPVWLKKNKFNKKKKRHIKTSVNPLLKYNQYIYEYGFDQIGLASPSDNNRVMWFTCGDKDYGENIRDSIMKII